MGYRGWKEKWHIIPFQYSFQLLMMTFFNSENDADIIFIFVIKCGLRKPFFENSSKLSICWAWYTNSTINCSTFTHASSLKCTTQHVEIKLRPFRITYFYKMLTRWRYITSAPRYYNLRTEFARANIRLCWNEKKIICQIFLFEFWQSCWLGSPQATEFTFQRESNWWQPFKVNTYEFVVHPLIFNFHSITNIAKH